MIVSRHVVIEKDLTANMMIDEAGMFRVQWLPAPPLGWLRRLAPLRGHGAINIVPVAVF